MDYSTISAARYECIVCHLKTLTIAELHRHQTYRHTTEELSLTTIGLRSSLNGGTIKDDGATYARSWLCDPQKRAEFYAYSARLLNDVNNNASFDRRIPLDCVVRKEESLAESLSEAKVRSADRGEDTNVRKHPRVRRAECLHASNSDVLDLSRRKKAPSRVSKSAHKSTHSSATSEAQKVSTKIEKNRPKTEKDKSVVRSGTPRRRDKTTRNARFLGKSKDDPASTKEVKPIRTRDTPTSSASGNSREKMKKKSPRKEKEIAAKAGRTERKKDDKKRARGSGGSGKLKSASLGKAETLRIPPSENDTMEMKNREYKKTYGAKKRTSFSEEVPKFDRTPVKFESSAEEIASENESARATLPNDYLKERCNDELCDDLACYDILEEKPACPENFELLALMIHPQNDMPDVSYEICVGTTQSESTSLILDGSLHSSNENFEKAESFPPYPRNMDERSILVFDPETRNLVWTSFELANDSVLEDNDDPRDTSDIILVTDDDSVDCEKCEANDEAPLSASDRESKPSEAWPKNEDYIPERCGKIGSTVARPSSMKSRGKEHASKRNTPERRQPETNGDASASEENWGGTGFSVRAKRNRIIPDRYVPY